MTPDAALVNRAVQVVLTASRPTPGLLQRRLDLSFAEARELLMHLEDLDVVRAPHGRGPWEPLIDLREWERRADG